jgi:hypothetical protein
MPFYIRDRIVLPSHLPPYFKVELLSAIFSAIAYGIVVVLSGNCFHLLLKKRDIYPNRMRIILPIYVIIMLLCSTWNQIGRICLLMEVFTPLHASVFLYNSFQLLVIVTTWGADGFMVRIPIIHQEQSFIMQLQIWRCLVLYQDVSRGPRIGIIVLLSLISSASFGKPMCISTLSHSNYS